MLEGLHLCPGLQPRLVTVELEDNHFICLDSSSTRLPSHKLFGSVLLYLLTRMQSLYENKVDPSMIISALSNLGR